MNIYEKLAIIQAELKAPKGQYNSFGKYAYRSCEDILEALKPLLKEHKATVVISDDIVDKGDRYYVKAVAQFIDVESDAGPIISTAFAREPAEKKGQDASQITGSASSYARKYALNGLFCIDDNKDADATNTGNTKKTTKTATQVVTCPKCGNEVKPIKKADNSIVPAIDVLNKCGGMCYNCYSKLNGGK